MRTLLALDVATSTGWAFGPVDAGSKPALSGHVRFWREGACDEDVWFKAMVWLTDQINVLNPDVIAMEAPINSASPAGGSNAATLGRLIGLQSVLRTVVRAKKPSLAKLIHVQSARKFFIGAGNLPGGEAKKRVQTKCIQLGWLSVEDLQADRCDALCVWAKAAGDIDAGFAASFTPSKSKLKRVPAPADVEF